MFEANTFKEINLDLNISNTIFIIEMLECVSNHFHKKQGILLVRCFGARNSSMASLSEKALFWLACHFYPYL